MIRNLEQPLRKGLWVKAEDGMKNICILLLYEWLPNFYFAWGKLGHVMRDCDVSYAVNEEPEIGVWLRAPVAWELKNPHCLGLRMFQGLCLFPGHF